MNHILTNAIIVTMNEQSEIIQNGYVIINDGIIRELGPMIDLKNNVEGTRYNCQGKIITPGMINTHTHLGLIPLRSMADDLPDRLRQFLFPMEMKYMNAKLVQAATAFGAMESLKSGVTTVADMYYFTDEVMTALDQIGIRGLCGQTIIKENACDRLSEDEALQVVETLIQKWQGHPRLQVMVAPHGTTTVSTKAMIQAAQIARKHHIKMMVHTSEMTYEMEHFKKHNNQTPIEYLNDIGVLGPHFIAVHCIFAQHHDFKILAQSNSSVAHCLIANMKSGKGVMDLKSLLEAGVNVSLGTDGPISGNTLDLWSQMRFVPLVHKTINHDRAYLPSDQVVQLATNNGSKTLGLADKVGSLEVGKAADLITIDPQMANVYPVHDIYATLVYAVQTQNVCDVMVDGQWVVKDHRLLTMDEANIKSQLEAAMAEINRDYHQGKQSKNTCI